MYDKREAAEVSYEGKQERRIQQDHDKLRALYTMLDEQLTRLSERLEKVLQPDHGLKRPEDNRLTPVDATPVSPLAARFMDDQTTVGRLVERVTDIIDRCEL